MATATSDAVRFFFAWQPVLRSDARAAAEAHAAGEKDARARHYWDEGLALGRAYAAPLATPYPTHADGKALAWDVVMVFARGVGWGSELPKPALHMFPPEEAGGTPGFSVERLRAELDARLAG